MVISNVAPGLAQKGLRLTGSGCPKMAGVLEDNAFAKLLQATQLKTSKPTFVEIKKGSLKRKRTAGKEFETVGEERDNGALEYEESGVVVDGRNNCGLANRTGKSKGRQKAPKKEVDERLGCTLFVGNLPLNMTRKKLKALFCMHGAVDSVRFRSVVGERVGGSKRPLLSKATRFNAYVVFTEPSAAKTALELNGHVIDGQHLRVDMAGNSHQHSHGKSVFVGNIPHEVTEDELRVVFTEFGEIDGIRLVRDKVTGLCKGFGFVLFKDSASVLLATKFKGIKLRDRQLRVFRSRPMTNRHHPPHHNKLPHFAGEVAEGRKRERKSFPKKKRLNEGGRKDKAGVKKKAYSEGTKLGESTAVSHKFQKKKLKYGRGKTKHARGGQ